MTAVTTSFKTIHVVDSDEKLEKLSHELVPHWVFRGHGDQEPGLKTTLQLACERHGLPLSEAPNVEKTLLREFGRRAHLYIKDDAQMPFPGDTLEWISLMRHYGAPTRVLDWSYSIFVAAHFALSASKQNEPCVIWAVDTKKLNDQAENESPGVKNPSGRVQKSGQHFRDFYMSDHPKAFVATATPYRLNERLAIQRGVFLCPGDVRKSFLD